MTMDSATLLDRLRRLHDADADPDPQLWPALGELSGTAERARVGRLLAGLPARLVAGDERRLSPLRVGVTGTFTTDGLTPLLRTALLAAGINAELLPTGYGRLMLDLGDPASELAEFAPQVTLCVLHDEALLPADWNPADLAGLTEQLCARAREIGEQAAAFAARTGSAVVLHTVPLSLLEYRTVISQRGRSELARAWRRANLVLLDLADGDPALHVLDLDVLVAGAAVALRDERRWRFARMAWTPGVEDLYAAEAAAFCRGLCGRTGKVLVLDLDDTLWGGILGDVGPDGIELGTLYPGNAYLELQRRAKLLRQQGVLLAIASKNSPELVDQVFAEHPDLLLRADDFAARAVDWEPKDANLRQLAETLNLGLDSFVFVDDSAFERELIRTSLPEVAVVRSDGDPAEVALRLLDARLFDVPELTAADRERSERYRAAAQRRSSRDAAGSTEGFLATLELCVRVRPADAYAAPRVAQLLRRTHQFNASAVAWSEAELRASSDADDRIVLVFDVRDRFGAEDGVGAVLLLTGADRWTITNVVMSCRVFSRGIEFAVLHDVARRAAAAGAVELRAQFTSTDRNGPARAFLDAAAFGPPDSADGQRRLALRPMPRVPEWIRLESSDG
jgi:FkbH-like protein